MIAAATSSIGHSYDVGSTIERLVKVADVA